MKVAVYRVDNETIYIERIPSNAKLVKVNGYYAYSKGRIVRRVITEKPSDPKVVIEYALVLRMYYKKNVDLKIVDHKLGRFIRFKREDGFPIYVNVKTLDVYVKHSDLRNPVFAKAIGFFLNSCGYRVREKTVMRI